MTNKVNEETGYSAFSTLSMFISLVFSRIKRRRDVPDLLTRLQDAFRDRGIGRDCRFEDKAADRKIENAQPKRGENARLGPLPDFFSNSARW